MDEKLYTQNTLCPDQIDQMTETLNWLNLVGIPLKNVVEFDHTDCHLRSVALGKKLYESAETHATLDPQYKSLNHMVETLIWRELGSRPEFLRSTGVAKNESGNSDQK